MDQIWLLQHLIKKQHEDMNKTTTKEIAPYPSRTVFKILEVLIYISKGR